MANIVDNLINQSSQSELPYKLHQYFLDSNFIMKQEARPVILEQ